MVVVIRDWLDKVSKLNELIKESSFFKLQRLNLSQLFSFWMVSLPVFFSFPILSIFI
jgi:hypothetical protein